MYCTNCGKKVILDEKCCADCGVPTNSNFLQYCFACGEKTEPESAVCKCCGTELMSGIDEKVPEFDSEKLVEKEVEEESNEKEIGLTEAIKNDLGNSETARLLKSKIEEKSGKSQFSRQKKMIAALLAVVVLVFIIATNIHTCEECEKVYFGKEYSISFFGEHEGMCKECYDNFFCW